jgi:hypothetical protein
MTSIRDYCPDCRETGWACKCRTPDAQPSSTDEVERLREALEPFAKAADIKLCGEWADDKHFGQTDVGFHLTFGDLRRARAAIAAMVTKP